MLHVVINRNYNIDSVQYTVQRNMYVFYGYKLEISNSIHGQLLDFVMSLFDNNKNMFNFISILIDL